MTLQKGQLGSCKESDNKHYDIDEICDAAQNIYRYCQEVFLISAKIAWACCMMLAGSVGIMNFVF